MCTRVKEIEGFLGAMGRSKHRIIFYSPQAIFLFVLEVNTFQRYERNTKAQDQLKGWRMQKTKQ